jgi:hypothetical protein
MGHVGTQVSNLQTYFTSQHALHNQRSEGFTIHDEGPTTNPSTSMQHDTQVLANNNAEYIHAPFAMTIMVVTIHVVLDSLPI